MLDVSHLGRFYPNGEFYAHPGSTESPDYRWWILDLVDRHFLQANIQKYLGPDATCRPARNNRGERVYLIAADRTFTTAQMEDLRADCAEWLAHAPDPLTRSSRSRRHHRSPVQDSVGIESSSCQPAYLRADFGIVGDLQTGKHLLQGHSHRYMPSSEDTYSLRPAHHSRSTERQLKSEDSHPSSQQGPPQYTTYRAHDPTEHNAYGMSPRQIPLTDHAENFLGPLFKTSHSPDSHNTESSGRSFSYSQAGRLRNPQLNREAVAISSQGHLDRSSQGVTSLRLEGKGPDEGRHEPIVDDEVSYRPILTQVGLSRTSRSPQSLHSAPTASPTDQQSSQGRGSRSSHHDHRHPKAPFSDSNKQWMGYEAQAPSAIDPFARLPCKRSRDDENIYGGQKRLYTKAQGKTGVVGHSPHVTP